MLAAVAASAAVGAQGAAPAAPALAALPPGLLEQGLVEMKQAAETLVKAMAMQRARITVTAGVPDSRLKLAPCTAGTASLVPGLPAWGATRLNLRCTQGAGWNILLPVKVQVFAPAVVAASALSSGTALAASHLAVAEVDWAAHGGPPSASARSAPAQAAGQPALFTSTSLLHQRQLARPLAPGAPVRTQDLQSRQWFAAGSTVSVVAQGEGFSVVSEGQALTPGLEGQPVRVRTESGRVLSGLATGERRVELRL